MYCILVAGMPAAGKSTIAEVIYLKTLNAKTISCENFVCGIEKRGFDAFCVGGRQIKVGTTDFSEINMGELFSKIEARKEGILHD